MIKIDKISVDNTEVNCRWIEGNSGCSIVFIHGAGGDSRIFDLQLKGLGGKYTAIAVDLPAHGESDFSGETSLDLYVRSVEAVIKAFSLKNTVIAGHSMGGGVVFELLKKGYDAIQGGVLIASNAVLPVNSMILDVINRDYDGFCEMATGFMFSKGADRNYIDIVKNGLIRAGAGTTANDFMICRNFDFRSDLKNLSMPVLLIANENDKMVSIRKIRETEELIPDGRLICYAAEGHMPQCEMSDTVNSDLSDFLSAVMEK